MAASQQEVDAMKATLDTEISKLKEDIQSLRGELVNKTSNADFQKLHQMSINDITAVQKILSDMADQFQKHLDDQHGEISIRFAALEKVKALEETGRHRPRSLRT